MTQNLACGKPKLRLTYYHHCHCGHVAIILRTQRPPLVPQVLSLPAALATGPQLSSVLLSPRAQEKPEPWEVPTPSGPCSQGFVCRSLNERPMTQDKIGNRLGLATADSWSTRKMSLVIYLTVSRISQRERDK